MLSVLTQSGLRLVNHLLSTEGWAVERLRGVSGASIRIEGGRISQTLVVDGHGRLQRAATEHPADVSVSLPDDFAVRWLVDRRSLLSAIQIAGRADVAETLAFVFRNLRWDAGADLSPYVGDIVAQRIVGFARFTGEQLGDAWRRGANNLLEYVTEESRQVVVRPEWTAFCGTLADTDAEISSLERRIGRL